MSKSFFFGFVCLSSVSTVLRGAFWLQHEPYQEPSTCQRTDQVHFSLIVLIFCIKEGEWCSGDALLYLYQLQCELVTCSKEMGGGQGVVYLTVPTMLLPLLRCQITSELVFSELCAWPRAYKSDSVTWYARLCDRHPSAAGGRRYSVMHKRRGQPTTCPPRLLSAPGNVVLSLLQGHFSFSIQREQKQTARWHRKRKVLYQSMQPARVAC